MKQVVMVGMVTLSVMLAGTNLAEDKLVLKDGQVVTGDIVSESDTSIEIDSGDETIRVPTWAIETIERDDSGPQPADSSGAGVQVKASPAMQAWIDTCVEHLASSDNGVRSGAKAALRAAGPAAAPALKKASGSTDRTVATVAQQLLVQIERSGARAAAKPRKTKSGLMLQQERKVSKLVRSLGLNEDQRPQFEKILAELHAGQREVGEELTENALTREQSGARIISLRAQARQKLASVLTEEQMKQYSEMMPTQEERSAARINASETPKPESR